MVDQSPWWSPVSDRHVQRILPVCTRIAAKVGPVMPALQSFAPSDRDLTKGTLQSLGHRPADDLHRGEILDGSKVEPAFARQKWSKKRFRASPPRTVRAPFSAYGSPFKFGSWP